MSTIANERTKLLANALDRASTAYFTVDVATPLAGWVYDLGGLRTLLPPGALAAGVFGWIGAALALHVIARLVLGRIRP